MLRDTSQRTAADIEAVIKRYAEMVYRLAFSTVRTKDDADDIFQEVFLRYLSKAPAFEGDEHQKAWLIRVTINCAKKHLSSSWFRKTQPLEDHVTFSLPQEDELHQALKKLAPKYRAVIHLFYYEGYQVNEISVLLNRKESTVRAQLTRARQQLSRILKEES